MDKKIKKKLRKILKVIKMFEENTVIYTENNNLNFDDEGNPIQIADEKTVKMAIMTPKTTNNLYDTIDGSFLSEKKEGYYILKDKEDFKITENMKLKYKNIVYRVIKVENNYDIFLRMELNIDDRRN